jgi:serine protease Do
VTCGLRNREEGAKSDGMKTPRFLLPLVLAGLAGLSSAETVKDRAGAVLGDRAAMENDPRWIYNDFKKGFAEAKRTGKPLLVTLRCVPCLACAGIDARILQNSVELVPLLDQFVCVRVINANALDLSLFQVDFDLSFSTVFFNADGTVYGRYGSWTHQINSKDETIEGYRRALEAALAIHKGYPGNQPLLAGKQGAPLPFKDPLQIPALAGKYERELDWRGKVVQSCVHCHQVGDAIRASYRDQNKPIPTEWVYPWPAPQTIGLTLAPDRVARVESVLEGSPAAAAGFRVGDDIVSLGDQPLVSIADVSWVLNRFPESGSLSGSVKRGDSERPLEIKLPAGWRQKSDISRRVGTWPMRAMAAGGMVLVDLTDEQRAQRGIDTKKLALFVKSVGQYGKHAAAKKAGFEKEDVIVELDGQPSRVTESALLGRLLAQHLPGEQVKATVLRGTDRVELSLPMQ